MPSLPVCSSTWLPPPAKVAPAAALAAAEPPDPEPSVKLTVASDNRVAVGVEHADGEWLWVGPVDARVLTRRRDRGDRRRDSGGGIRQRERDVPYAQLAVTV